MLEVAGYQVFCRCSLRTFKKDIIVGIGACLYRIRRPDPMAVFANRLQRRGDDLWAALKSRPADDLFILRVYIPADTKLHYAAKRQFE